MGSIVVSSLVTPIGANATGSPNFSANARSTSAIQLIHSFTRAIRDGRWADLRSKVSLIGSNALSPNELARESFNLNPKYKTKSHIDSGAIADYHLRYDTRPIGTLDVTVLEFSSIRSVTAYVEPLHLSKLAPFPNLNSGGLTIRHQSSDCPGIECATGGIVFVVSAYFIEIGVDCKVYLPCTALATNATRGLAAEAEYQ